MVDAKCDPLMLPPHVQVTFIAPHGQVEAGIDGGGLFKEFLEILLKQAADVGFGLLKETD